MKPLSISVGIVAYNEEKNIASVIGDIMSQKGSGWALRHIYVACGGCTDRTVTIVRSLHIPFLTLIVNPRREGKAADEQKIFDAFTDDILVLFDADVRLEGNRVIDRLVAPLIAHPGVQQTGGNARPVTPVMPFERAVYTTFMVLDRSRALHGGNNIYGASGQCIALTYALVKKIRFPEGVIAEDDFIYFTNKKAGGDFRYIPDAIVRYKLPRSIADYFRQTQRSDTAASIAHVKAYFGDMVNREYARPMGWYANAVFASFLNNPIGTLGMIGIRLLSRIVLPYTSRHYRLGWYTAASTKRI